MAYSTLPYSTLPGDSVPYGDVPAEAAIRFDPEQIERAIKAVEGRFADRIERIDHAVREDVAGDSALFFLIVLKGTPESDATGHEECRKQRLVTFNSATAALQREVQSVELKTYFEYRTVSERD